jgi:steroid 5-alpha reductase family enzyme
MPWWALLPVGEGVAASLMTALWLWQLRTGKATAVDAGWATTLVLLAVLYALLGGGEPEHRILIGLLAGLENGRIAWLVGRRVGGEEDSRYRELRARWRSRGREQLSFFVFYQAQGLLAVLLSLPLLAAAFNGHDGLEALELAGFWVWAAGASFEAVADAQLSGFKADPGNRGKTMRFGLWRLSRHPNYFGQWLTWCGYGLIALAAPWGWVGLLSPALMLYLILFVTGVPPSEERALASRGEDFRRYQRETSVFVPWFPR